MSSIDKLKRLTGENMPLSVPRPAKKAQIDDLRRRIDDVVSHRRRNAPAFKVKVREDNLREFVSGAEVHNDCGKFFLASEVVCGSCRHGRRCIGESCGFDMAAAALLADNPRIGELTCADALFLDTETTGLAGGTGTMAFLIGLGWFEAGNFRICQLLARDFGEEKAALAHFAGIAAKKKFLVTFNGKAFDVNLLATRFIMNRLPGDPASLPQLDLLHPSRRLLGHRLENSRLCTLEAEIMGLERAGDIPGWEIPQRYFDWLRRRDGRLLAAIFEHNRLDVISMAVLAAHLTEIITAECPDGSIRADDYLSAARLLLKRRNAAGADKILNMLRQRNGADFSPPAKKKLAQLYKSTGQWHEAVQIWQEMTSCPPLEFSAVSELAKWLEHRVRDYGRALRLVESALDGGNDFSAAERDSLLHRYRRLQTKLADGR
ncbi:MAG TPA: ribonuclease H-like domain-containing protein [Smithellaceae bacterium]|nr:ribonuclease H-like domain-containing protein [Smithellaceae bacterium]